MTSQKVCTCKSDGQFCLAAVHRNSELQWNTFILLTKLADELNDYQFNMLVANIRSEGLAAFDALPCADESECQDFLKNPWHA